MPRNTQRLKENEEEDEDEEDEDDELVELVTATCVEMETGEHPKGTVNVTDIEYGPTTVSDCLMVEGWLFRRESEPPGETIVQS